ncbi:hypothetical protein SLITO_v1c02120 [Spiroplasma litorale]|uniref:AB hydrolase-1 domain-containing protein n=1 Tax=Spiroplasma litorale TaxID=216942 RepID=A0A0K1W129_9MOLU|nr:alpha/beta fold hydrolase [Spiroplasma litorale]AKX33873.1 hypothetical protein SLITO_v1c02120 [Spiroplasma litorale]
MNKFLIWIIIGIVLFILLLIIIRYLISKKLTKKHKRIVKNELIKKKFFITSDNYELRWLGEILPVSKKILICVHDYGLSRKSFKNFEEYVRKNNSDVSVISYDQRGSGENKFYKNLNMGSHLLDLEEIIVYISTKYSDKEIFLVGEGFGSNLASYFSDNKRIKKIIFVSMHLNQIIHKSFKVIFKILMASLISTNIQIKQKIYIEDCVSKIDDNNIIDIDFVSHKKMKNLLQIRKINSKIKKNIVKNVKKYVFLLPGIDIFVKKNTFINIFNDEKLKDLKIDKLSSKKHYVFYEKNNIEIFKTIINNI